MSISRVLSCFVAFVTLSATPVFAHPGSGIVVMPDGTIYFADVGRETIWKVSPDGTMTPLLRDFWTHDIKLGSDGSVYFEREGDGRGGPAPRALWRMKPGGEPELVIPETFDFATFSGEPFAVGAAGDIYFAHMVRGETNEWRALIRKRTPDGTITTLAGGLHVEPYQDGIGEAATLHSLTGMAMGPDDMIFVLNRDRLRTISPDGKVTTIAAGLLDDKPTNPPEKSDPTSTINRLTGVCIAADGSVFIAYQAGRRVIRVAPGIGTSVACDSPAGWSPLGVAQRGGVLYILENPDRSNDVPGPRVRRIKKDGTVETVAAVE